MEQVKVFISQPMKGLSDADIQYQRDVAIQHAKTWCKDKYPDKEVAIIDSFFQDYKPDPNSNNAVKYLSKSIDLLADADLAVFAGAWDTARGCKIEHTIATEYGIETLAVNFTSV